MARLIIHIGPGKCGSSSIQDFLSSATQACSKAISYSLLSAVKIDKLENQPNDQNAINYFKQILSDGLINDNTVINAITHGYTMPGPHVDNALIHTLSSELGTSNKTHNNFMSKLMTYHRWLLLAIEQVALRTLPIRP